MPVVTRLIGPSVMVTGLFLGGLLATSPIAGAAGSPGSATAKGVVVDLNASIAGVSVVNADATIGNDASPPSISHTAVNASTSGGEGTTAAGVVTTSATTSASDNEGSAQITGFSYSLLGAPLLAVNGSVISADANCPTGGQPSATTDLAGLALLGTTVNPAPNTSVSESINLTPPAGVPGLTALSESATLNRVEQITATGALASTVVVDVTLSATILGTTTSVPAGTITLASVTCATATNATGPTGNSGPTPTTAAPLSQNGASVSAPAASGASAAVASSSPAKAAPAASSASAAAASSSPAKAAPAKTATTLPPSNGPSLAGYATGPNGAGTPVLGATTVHTGEPWAGSWPYVLVLGALGLSLLGFGVRERRRTATRSS